MAILTLILAKWAAQVWLARLNQRHVLARADAVPPAFQGIVDDATYAKSVQYTLAKGRLDRIEGLLLGLALGYPLLVLVLKLVEWTGPWWWLWAWGALLGFQLVMAALAPVLILPLFNKFTPLPDGGLRQRLLRLAERTQF